MSDTLEPPLPPEDFYGANWVDIAMAEEAEEVKSKQRSLLQNNALHKYFEELATELNNRGLYISQVIKVDAEWNKDRVKELIWRPTQEKVLQKKSTTELTTAEIDQIFKPIHKALAEMGCDVQFPSREELIHNNRAYEN